MITPSSRTLPFRNMISLLLLLAVASDAFAARRSVRIDVKAWSNPPVPIEDCRGYSGGTSLHWGGYTFKSGFHLTGFTPYSYCQTANPYVEGLPTSDYLNSTIFEDDEAGLASRIGSNTSNSVTAEKYTYLDEFGNGFQWAFYYFPGGSTWVGFYSTRTSQAPSISSGPSTIAWDETYNGEYFCFEGVDLVGLSEDGTSCTPYPPPGVSDAERNALVALYNSTDGDNWFQADNWLTGDPCHDSWFGVSCFETYDEETGFDRPTVGELQLSSNNMTGPLPSQLGDLVNMYSLDLSNNQISGGIPLELGNLTELNELYLHSNKLTGLVPGSMQNLENVWLMSLSYNGLQTPNTMLDSFLDGVHEDGDWSLTQTIPPANLTVTAAGPTSIDLSWDAIEYTEDTGRYRLWYSQSPDGPFLDGGATDNKLDTTHTISGLAVYTPYYVTVRTETDSHDSNSNDLESENSELVSNKDHPDFYQVFSDGFE